jgi:hypothetical protein
MNTRMVALPGTHLWLGMVLNLRRSTNIELRSLFRMLSCSHATVISDKSLVWNQSLLRCNDACDPEEAVKYTGWDYVSMISSG